MPFHLDPALKVIVAEDYPQLRDALTTLLIDCGLEHIKQAIDGVEVIELVKSDPPNVVVMDIQMPKIDGITATRQIKRIAPNAKIIGLSIADPMVIEMIYDAGADGFVPKDLALETLCPEIERLCG